MLIYVDESKNPNPQGTRSHITLAGAAIAEDAHKELNSRLFKLKQRFWKVTQYCDHEIKGRDLLRPGWEAHPRNIEFTRELLSLCRLYDIKSFGVTKQYLVAQREESLILDEAVPGANPSDVLLSSLYKYMLERVDLFIRERNREEYGIMIFDEKDLRRDESRAIGFSNFMHRSNFGRAITNVVETAFFVSSRITPGIQIADVFAYVLNQYFDGRRDLREFYDEIAALQFISDDPTAESAWRGIKYMKAKPPEEDKEKGETAA